ncbi:MAG: hemerythrin domain-containing protein [Deltaproteobacteria bacterium]|nr:hemerythrin domain-containing protein [Deltaproteobacteria bacterium]
MDPIKDLTAEHEAVRLTLRVLEEISTAIDRSGKIADGDHIDSLLEFFGVFVDKCHHGKEEKLLFPALEEVGVGNEGGPIGVMLAEHRQGRELVGAMRSAMTQYRQGEAAAAARFSKAAKAYIDLLNRHIEKENNVLFSIADQHLSKDKLSELKKGFDRLETEEIGIGRHAEFHRMLENLEKVYLQRP